MLDFSSFFLSVCLRCFICGLGCVFLCQLVGFVDAFFLFREGLPAFTSLCVIITTSLHLGIPPRFATVSLFVAIFGMIQIECCGIGGI